VLLFCCVLPCGAEIRRYYIAAEDVTWDYAPSGFDLIEGRPIPLPWARQTKWAKTRYIEYTDASFSVRKPQPEWLGILGPVIRAEVGDEIVVEFLNRSRFAHSIHPHGLRYDKNSEGAYYLPAGHGSLISSGGRFTYHWFADKGSGPGPDQLSSVVWWYHPHTEEPRETNAGLLGPIIITAKGKAKPDGSPKDVDREFVASFMIFDELPGKDAGQFHSINGYVFGNLPGLYIKKGEKVRWYLLGMGNEKDLHTPHWHGKTVSDGKRNTDVVELLPASMVSVDMRGDNPGTWIFHCQVTDHMEAGMMALFTIYEPQARTCPIKFVAGNFWNTSGKYSLTVQNASGKAIKELSLISEHFLAPQYLHRPFDSEWPTTQPIPPEGQQVLEKNAYVRGSDSILGWALFPSRIVYADGTTWIPQHEGECFEIYWRDKDHPNFPVLPPHQIEMQED
jgi:manganese oxidase